MSKISLKYLKRIILLLCTLIIGYFLIAFILSLLSTTPKNMTCHKKHKIFVSTNGIHLDIILPKDDLPTSFQQELKLERYVNYVSFGWGDKGFYLETPTWDDLKFSTAVNALFLKSETVMHLTKYSHQLERWQTIPVCEDQINTICQYISHSFDRNSKGEIKEIRDSGYTNFDTFYEAKGNYNVVNTCNNWVNKALKKATIKTSIWSPFDQGVLYHLE